MAGRGRGRGLELTRPAWMSDKHVPPSLPKPTSTPTEVMPASSASEWRTATAPNGRRYWYNSTTGASSWTDPTRSSAPPTTPPASQLPDEWREHHPPNGRPYFYNVRTRETKWSRPESVEKPATAASSSEQQQLPPGWARNTAADGRVYYYHATTRETRWTLPEAGPANSVDKKSPPVKAAANSVAAPQMPLPPGWAEIRANDGSVYYHHAATSRTSWARPRDEAAPRPPPIQSNDVIMRTSAAAAREPPHREAHAQGPAKRPRIGAADSTAAARIGNAASQTYRRPRDSEGDPMSNRPAEKWLLARAARRKAEKEAALAETKKADPSQPEKQGNASESKDSKDVLMKDSENDGDSSGRSASERKSRFMAMLDDRGVQVGNTWFRAMCLCVDDERYLDLPTYGERKSAFHAWSQKKMSQQRREEVKKNLTANDEFLEMLKEVLHNEPMYRRAIEDCRSETLKRVRESKEYRAIKSDACRQNLARAFLDNRRRSYERKKAEDRKRMLRTVRETLDAMTEPSIRPKSSRRVKSDGERETPAKEQYGPPWLDDRSSFREVEPRLSELSFFRELDKRDVRDIFQDWIRDVDKTVEDKRIREKETRKVQQRANRAKFRAGVLQMMLEGRVSFRAQWREVATDIGKEPFACPENELGERPGNLFKDALDDFDEKVHEHKEGFKELIRESSITVNEETTLETLNENEKVAEFLKPLPKSIASALLIDRKRKEHRRRQHALTDYEEMLRELFRRDELQLDSTFEAVQPVLEAKDQTKGLVAIAGVAEARRSFDEFIERRKAREARRSKRRSDDTASQSEHKRPRLHDPRARTGQTSRDEETGWAAAVSAKPLSAAEKAAALEKKKKKLLASLKAGKSASPATTRPKPSVSPPASAKPKVLPSQEHGSGKPMNIDSKSVTGNGISVQTNLNDVSKDPLKAAEITANAPIKEEKESGEI